MPPASIWEVRGAAPVEVVEARNAESLTVAVPQDHARTVRVPLGYSPGWRAEVDGELLRTDRDADGILTVEVPSGAQEVDLTWSEPAGHGLGRWLTVATVLALAATRLRSRHARESLGG